MQRQELEAAGIDFDVELVDGTVAAEHAIDDRAVAIDQRLHHRAHSFLRQAAHFEQTRLELLELFLKMGHGGHYPNLPVT